MSKTSRRDFLKGTAAAVLGGSIIAQTKSEAKTVSAADFGLEKKVPLLCRMCAQFCPMIATVRDGRIVRMEANMDTPYGGVCGRGRAAMGALYDPDRIKTPLIRIGERGDGGFREASWDEALDLVAKKLKEIEAQGDQKSVAFLPRFNSAPGIDKEFFKIYGTPNIVGYGDVCFGNGLTVGLSAIAGGALKGGIPDQSTGAVSPDYENAKFGLLLQRNPGGGLVCHAWGNMFGKGKRNGLEIAVVDPRKPSEAGETDAQWISIRPGTDAALLLGLMNEIFKHNYFDASYLAKHTNSDMLINVATGQPVKTQKIEKEVKGKKVEILDYLVATEEGFMLKSVAQKSKLFGSFEVEIEGVMVACKTALEMMKESASLYTPEWASEQTTIPVETITNLAKKLNDTKPACFIERGYRSERYASSLREKLLITQINVLLGAFGVKGGVFYNRSVKTANYITPPKAQDKAISEWYLKNDPSSMMMSVGHYRRTWIKTVLSEKPYKQRMAIFSGQNIVGGSSGADEIVKGLKKLEMIVAISPFFNETIMYADVVLPDCTFMERDEPLNTSYKTPLPTIGVNRKAVEPMYQSKDGYWIIMQLAKRTLKPEVFEQYFGEFEREGIMAIWKKQYSKLSGLNEKETATLPPLESILNGRVWTGEKQYGVKAKGTPTGKLEIYSTFLATKKAQLDALHYERADHASPLPVFNKPFWLEKKPVLDKNEFIPITGFHPLGSFSGQQTKNNTLLQEIYKDTNADAVLINKKKGMVLGLKSNDIIEIINIDKPKMVSRARVILSEVVHPDALFCYYGIGAGYYKNMTCSLLRNVSKIGFNPNHVADFTFNPLTTGQPAQDFIVSIRRSV